MNSALVAFTLLWAGAQPESPRVGYRLAQPFRMDVAADDVVLALRGQSPVYDEPTQTPAIAVPPTGPGYNPFSPQPMVTDPFLTPAPAYQAGPSWTGTNGPQPYRFGWTPKLDVGYLAPQRVNSGAGSKFEVVEYDLEMIHRELIGPDLILTSTPEFGLRTWEGPREIHLPANVYRFGWNLGLESAFNNAFSWHMFVNPSINSDLQSTLTSDAWNIDAKMYGVWQIDPTLQFVFGAFYWDRRDDIVLPYGGLVWYPTDDWEVRALFPEGRVSHFIGNFWEGSHWLYASYEFHVESYQFDMKGVRDREQIQLKDWRFAVGIRSDHAYFEKYIEVGMVFNRDVEFRHGQPNAGIEDGFQARIGLRF